MSDNNGTRRVSFADFVERKEEEHGFDIDMPDGTVVHVPAPELWSDEVGDAYRSGDLSGAARAVLGAEQWERFTAAGGTATALNHIVAEQQGMDVGESRPSPRS